MDQPNVAPQALSEHAAHAPSTIPILVAEVGTAMTKLSMVDLVDGAFRLITRAEAPSTLHAPNADAMLAVWHLIASIEGIRGRSFTAPDDQPSAEAPSTQPYHLIMTTSAVDPLRVAIMALAQSSAREAANAARGIYSNIVHTFSLAEAGGSDEHWLGDQLRALAQTKPDVLLVVGGLEQGALLPVERLARLAGLVARSLRPTPRILFAGNSAAAERVRAVIGDVTVVPNLRPTATTNRLEPTRTALRTVYAAQRLPTLAGYDALQSLVASDLVSVADNQGIMVRFLADRYARRIVFLDSGAAHSSGHMQADGHFTQVILAGHGIEHGAARLLDDTDVTTVERWLPFPAAQTSVANRLLNRTIHGNSAPVDGAELLLDHALLREHFLQVLRAMRAARISMEYDLVIAAGAITRAPRPGLAALTLLDVLALDNYYGALAIDLYLDGLGLFAVSGALAHIHPDAAACVLEQDALNSGPLATLLVPQGAVVEGSPVLDVELTTTLADGETETQRRTVVGGQIVRLPLPRGALGTLRIKPVTGVRIGANEPGAEVTTEPEAIIGSALGVIIDARLRPLHLPADDAARIASLRASMEALDALPADLAEPYPVTVVDVGVDDEMMIAAVSADGGSPSVDAPTTDREPPSDDVADVAPRIDVEPAPMEVVAEDADGSVDQPSSTPRKLARVYEVRSRFVDANTDGPDDNNATLETASAPHMPDLIVDDVQDIVDVSRNERDDSFAKDGNTADGAAASAYPDVLEAAILGTTPLGTPEERPGYPGGGEDETVVDVTPTVPVDDAVPARNAAVMKDDVPAPAPEHPQRKKRRFRWW